MPGFETMAFGLAEPCQEVFDEKRLEALTSRSNFILKSGTLEDLGGPRGSAVRLVSSLRADEGDFAGLLTEDPDSGELGLYLRVGGAGMNDELFYLVLQNFRAMLRVPGVMVKGASTDLWIRIGQKAREKGIGLKELAGVLAARIRLGFPEIESVAVCFVRGRGPVYELLEKEASAFREGAENLKARVWESRGFNFTDCHVLGHCGQCADKKLCANVRRVDRLADARRAAEEGETTR